MGGWKACVTAGVCERTLLTLANDEQTRVKRMERGMEAGGEEIKKEKEVAGTRTETAVPL